MRKLESNEHELADDCLMINSFSRQTDQSTNLERTEQTGERSTAAAAVVVRQWRQYRRRWRRDSAASSSRKGISIGTC